MTFTFLLGLLSALLIAVAFRHLATKPSFYFACLYLFCCFSRRGYCRLAAIDFTAWVAVPFFASLSHFYSSRHFLPCHFHRCHPFYRCSASNITAFHSRLDLELPFLLWSCRRHIHFAAKDVFVATTSRRPIFLLLLFWYPVLGHHRYTWCPRKHQVIGDLRRLPRCSELVHCS